MIRATLDDVPIVADLLNDPAIRPTVGGEGYLDPTALISDRRNVCLFTDEGGALFAWRGPGIFEGHVFFKVRGDAALSLMRGILDAMFREYGAKMIWGLPPLWNRQTRWFCRRLGFESQGEMNTPEGECELFVMERR